MKLYSQVDSALERSACGEAAGATVAGARRERNWLPCGVCEKRFDRFAFLPSLALGIASIALQQSTVSNSRVQPIAAEETYENAHRREASRLRRVRQSVLDLQLSEHSPSNPLRYAFFVNKHSLNMHQINNKIQYYLIMKLFYNFLMVKFRDVPEKSLLFLAESKK